MITPEVIVVIIKYGRAINTILIYPNLILGAMPDINRNRKAACPLGVDILGIPVPITTAVACASYNSRDRTPASNSGVIWSM